MGWSTNARNRAVADFCNTTQLYIALFTSPPNDDGGGTEVSGGGYVRKPVSFNTATGSATTASTATQSVAAISFPTATADWGTVVAAGLYDAVTGGTFKGAATLTRGPRTILNGDTYRNVETNISLSSGV